MSGKGGKRVPILFDESEIRSVSKIFKALSDISRLRVISALTKKEHLSVSEIAKSLGLSTSSVSHHLTLLENLGFTSYTRDGKQVYYFLDDDCIEDILRRAKKHVGR